MRFCNKHWLMLREAIKDRGLWELVPQRGIDAATKARHWNEGVHCLNTFDPLMFAHNAIIEAVIHERGYDKAFKPNPDGSPRCPVCFSNLPVIDLAACDALDEFNKLTAAEAGGPVN